MLLLIEFTLELYMCNMKSKLAIDFRLELMRFNQMFFEDIIMEKKALNNSETNFN